ncbi:MAG: DUF3368 domain-containing protein [Chitinophagales bacterium]
MAKLIIADTSCLIVLSKIGKIDLLKSLYQKITITKEVKAEFGGKLPSWIKTSEVSDKQKQLDLEKKLDKGEASSIALALEAKDSTLIIDELKGRKIAHSLQINIIGTIGIVLLANKRGLPVDVIETILKIVNSGFRLSDKILNQIIKKYSK